MDTCKVANLFTCYPDADLLEFVNAPIGRGTPIDRVLRPLLCVPTTAGTGSETTGTAIFDHTATESKTGIASRALRPLLGIVDPLNTETCPTAVHVSAGLDVLFHALESYTAIPYTERTPRPANPLQRPAYQGRNPISDVFSLWALKQTVKYLPRVARDRTDAEARGQMLLAATFAGIGFGNAGVHLCHGMSYPISGLNKKFGKYQHPGYQVDHPIVPHGVSVALTGPAVFEFTAPSAPDRHREVAAIFDGYQNGSESTDIARLPDAEVGELVYDRIARFLADLGVPRGLEKIGYKQQHVEALVKGTIPQRRVLDLAPGIGDVMGADGHEHLARILEKSRKFQVQPVTHSRGIVSRRPFAHRLSSFSFSPRTSLVLRSSTLSPSTPSWIRLELAQSHHCKSKASQSPRSAKAVLFDSILSSSIRHRRFRLAERGHPLN